MLALELIQTLVVLAGFAWAIVRFGREGVHKPRMEIDLECSFFGPHKGRFVAAFVIHATNRGSVEHRFSQVRLRIRGIESDAVLGFWKGHEPLLEFPKREHESVDIVPLEMKPYFVRPGVHQRFSYVTSVPASWKFAIARAAFKYESTNQLHTAERAFELARSGAAVEPANA